MRFNLATSIATALTLLGFNAGIVITLLPQSASAQLIAPNTATEIAPLNSTSTTQSTFSFTNVLEYSDCLAAILDAYLQTDSSLPTRSNLCQGNMQQFDHDGLSKSQALELISAADFYSTHFLARSIYPPKGLRLRIAETFGFIYEIDQADPEILRRAAR